MDNVYLLSHSVHSCILPLPLLSVCIVDVLSSDFLYGTALSVLTYTLITQTARNPLLTPLPHQLFSSLFVCVCVSVCMCVCLAERPCIHAWAGSRRQTCAVVYAMESHCLDLRAWVRVLGVGEDNTLETALNKTWTCESYCLDSFKRIKFRPSDQRCWWKSGRV